MEFPCKSGGRHRLSRSGWANEEELSSGAKIVMAQLGLLSLFQEDSAQTFLEGFGENHTGEPSCGLLHRKEIGNLSFRLENDNRAQAFLDLRTAGTRLINQITDLSRDFRMSEPCLASGHFHCDGEELMFVSLDMGPQKSDEMARSAHAE